jgi:macrodomain Ter protein organizer (MatP/YcbG family)
VSIKIATLNINSCCTSRENPLSYKKWAEINATIKNEKIAILALQEMHLNQELSHKIQRTFRKRIEIYNSELEHMPRTSARVAFVIN